MAGTEPGRPNQRRRTRKDLLRAASRLMGEGRTPSLEDVAEEATISRATAYRYFPNVDALLYEASLDVVFPEAELLFTEAEGDDPIARLERMDAELDAMMASNDTALRMMLAHSVQRKVRGALPGKLPARQNRRTPLIEAALEPARKQFSPASRLLLTQALALVIGTEAHIVCQDVLQIDDKQARKVRRWVIRALVEAARG